MDATFATDDRPHSPEAIEQQMGRLDDAERAKILGENAARLLGIEIPR